MFLYKVTLIFDFDTLFIKFFILLVLTVTCVISKSSHLLVHTVNIAYTFVYAVTLLAYTVTFYSLYFPPSINNTKLDLKNED